MGKNLLQNFKPFSDDGQAPITVTLNMTWINSSIIAVKIFFEFHIFKFGRARAPRAQLKNAHDFRAPRFRALTRAFSKIWARARRARDSILTPHSCPPKQAGIYSAIFLDVLIQILRHTRQIKA